MTLNELFMSAVPRTTLNIESVRTVLKRNHYGATLFVNTETIPLLSAVIITDSAKLIYTH